MRKKEFDTWGLAEGEDFDPSSRNAILIIHGIGEQNPLETLDQFTRGLRTALNKEYSTDYQVIHRQIEYLNPNKQEDWLESYVCLEANNAPSFDVYEYYWAHHMTDAASIEDIVEWLKETSSYASKFYVEQSRLFEKNKDKKQSFTKRRAEEPQLRNLFEPDGNFHKNGYLRNLGYWVRFLILLYKFLRYMAIKNWPFVQILYNSIEKSISKILVNYVGDVVVYTSMDRKAIHNTIRSKIINQARMEIESILKNEVYGSIFVAGHSLGSVVAYDVLNRLHTMPMDDSNAEKWKTSLNKVKGIITFGSPLDKIAFFFRHQVEKKQHIRRQMLNNLHSFKKSKPRDPDFDPGVTDFVAVKDEVGKNIDHAKWVNYFHRLDPVSGELDLYDVDENVPCKFESSFGIAHIKYWEYDEMYTNIVGQYKAEFVY